MRQKKTVKNSERVSLGDLLAESITQNFGDTYYQSETAVPRYLTTPPFKPDRVLGRTDELDQIRQILGRDDRPLLLMNGEGGIGKTTLAACYWYNEAARYKHLAWLFVEGGCRPALLSLADKLSLTFEPQTPDDERLALLLQRLTNLDSPCLLVLDNANDSEDLEAHYVNLRQLPNCHTLLTTRVDRMDEAARLKIGPLLQEQTIALFTRYCPILEEDINMLDNILVAVGYNTLVIELLAKNIKNRNEFSPDAYSLNNLLADLQAKGLLGLQTQPVQTTYGSSRLRTSKPEEILLAMYDLSKLTLPGRWLLNNLAVLPAESYTYNFLENLLAPTKVEPLKDGLLELRQSGWVDWHETQKTMKISPVVQAVVRDKNRENLTTDCAGLVASLNKNFETLNHTQLLPYAPLARSVVDALTELNADIRRLVFNLAEFLKGTSNLSEALTLFNRAADMIFKLDEFSDFATLFFDRATCIERIGTICQIQGNFDQALTHFKKHLALKQVFYQIKPHVQSHKEGVAIAYERLGSIYLAQNCFEPALHYFELQTSLFRELHENNPESEQFKNGLAVANERLGSLYQAQGNFNEALTYFEKQIGLYEELHENNPGSEQYKSGLAIANERLYNLHQSQGRFEQSLNYFEKYTSLIEELYEANPESVFLYDALAISYLNIGNLAQKIEQTDLARQYFRKAEKIWISLCNQVEVPEYSKKLARVQEILAELS